MELILLYLLVALVSSLPLFESKASIPLGIFVFNLNPWLTFIVAVTVNIIMIPLIFIFLDKINNFLLNLEFYKKFFDSYVKVLRRKMKKYGDIERITLFFFAALPLPLTGTYNTCVIAWFTGLSDYKTKITIATGVFVGGVSILLLTLGLLDFLVPLFYNP